VHIGYTQNGDRARRNKKIPPSCGHSASTIPIDTALKPKSQQNCRCIYDKA